jgi:hypothetical protein
MFRGTSRAQAAPSDLAPRYATAIVLGVALLSGCASTVEEPDSAGPVAASPDQTEEVAPTDDAEASSFDLCAEFPATPPTGRGDLEGWWSSTPANPDGSVIEDPADWPEPKMARHPRTAVIDVESGEVLSTWDRTTCTDDPDFVPVPNEQWPAVTDDKREFVVVDMDTNEVVNVTLASEY